MGAMVAPTTPMTSRPSPALLLFDPVLAGIATLGALIPAGRIQPVGR